MLEEHPSTVHRTTAHPSLTTPTRRFARTAAGTVVSAAMLGLRDALEGRKDDEPAIVEDWSGEPHGPDEILMRLDPDNPADSIVLIRVPRYVSDI
jgi:hypothetical protein